jgi:serine phosphatase RsbU (regulator of sigma subunit)
VIDARHTNGELFGMERLLKEFGQPGDGSAQDHCDRLWQRLTSFQSKTAQEDDVTLVVIKSTN